MLGRLSACASGWTRYWPSQTGQDLEKVEHDTERDYFMTAEESLAYGIIDKILEHR